MKTLRALAVAVVMMLGGCKFFDSLPPVEFCYVHPVYGQVCIKAGGKLFTADSLTPEQRLEVLQWVKDHPQ